MKNQWSRIKISLVGFLVIGVQGCSSSKKNNEETLNLDPGSSRGSTGNSAPVKESLLDDEKMEDSDFPAATPSSSGNSTGKNGATSGASTALTEALRSQRDEDIIREAGKVLSATPGDLKALNALAMAHYRQGRYTLSQSFLNKAKQLFPNSAEIHSNLGVVALAQNEKREAIFHFKKAIQLNSEDAVASANLGSIYVQERDFAKAKVALDIAYQKGFRDPKVLNNYAIALVAQKRFDRARELYEEILKKQSSNKEVLFNYSVLLIEHLQKYNEGLEVLQRLKFVGGPADSKNKIIALENKAKAGLK